MVYGAKSDREKSKIKEALEELHMLSIDDEAWEYLGELLYKLKRAGVTVPFQDAILAAVSITSGSMLWSRDKHFLHIVRVIDDLELFQP